MNFLQDYHTHTCFSFDGQTQPEALVRRAAFEGITHLALTDHAEFAKDVPEEEQFEAHVKNFSKAHTAFLSACDATRELPIAKAFGIEIGQPLFAPQASVRLAQALPFDVVLLSVHQILDYPDFYYVDFNEVSPETSIRAYFGEVIKSMAVADYDVLAHLFYPFRYLWQQGRQLSSQCFADEIDEVLRLAAAGGKALELNVSTMSSGLEPMPPRRILRRFRELGGERITIGTDDHKLLYQKELPARGLSVAAEAGFTHYTIYSGRKAVPIRFAR